ncbi:unnamed protein product [Dibothriocephalus latus]|uniref:Uncharacterized protein n=1 Tax=Dibothriocephalus latus TaxID=60516 RepID=A0A3P7LL04_DIBLA|nr:unnamed protein product [Dibothriocephalus latus]
MKIMEAWQARVMALVAEMHSCSWKPTDVEDITKWLQDTLEDRLTKATTEAIAAVKAEQAAATIATKAEESAAEEAATGALEAEEAVTETTEFQ